MKNNTTTKKVWQKPEVSDLDVNTGTSAPSKSVGGIEASSLAPSAS